MKKEGDKDRIVGNGGEKQDGVSKHLRTGCKNNLLIPTVHIFLTTVVHSRGIISIK